uniref:Putative secreted protein n=1 Tax=Anopheles darlingi TaxID=43151 RepID=A0A2M4D9P3_ANODA
MFLFFHLCFVFWYFAGYSWAIRFIRFRNLLLFRCSTLGRSRYVFNFIIRCPARCSFFFTPKLSFQGKDRVRVIVSTRVAASCCFPIIIHPIHCHHPLSL